jgi:Fe-S-cluster-containing hydrogenase component 2
MKKHGWRLERAIHNYIYFAWYYPYVKAVSILLSLAGYLTWFKPLKYAGRMAFNRYHSKVLTDGDTVKILNLNEDLRLETGAGKRVVPFKYAHKILFQDPGYIAVMDCPCKKSCHAAEDTINSCIVVGSGTGAFWVDRCGKKYHARRISQTEAIDMVKRFRKMGYITQAFFKVATGGSTGVICNCHPDTCVSLQASRLAREIDSSLTMSAKSGYSVRHDPSMCEYCGVCASVCHFGAISLDGSGRHYLRNGCSGCGLCVEHCPGGSLELYIDHEKPDPLDIELIKIKISGEQNPGLDC